MRFIIVVGYITEGLTFVGPFKEFSDASEYAENYIRGRNWEIVQLEKP